MTEHMVICVSEVHDGFTAVLCDGFGADFESCPVCDRVLRSQLPDAVRELSPGEPCFEERVSTYRFGLGELSAVCGKESGHDGPHVGLWEGVEVRWVDTEPSTPLFFDPFRKQGQP